MNLNLFLISAAAMVSVASGEDPIYTEIVDLGTASNFAILAKSGISTVPTSVVTGNIAVSPISLRVPLLALTWPWILRTHFRLTVISS